MNITNIFEAEKKDGLEQAIASSNSIAFCSGLSLVKSKLKQKLIQDRAIAYQNSFNANADQIDLFYFESLLASTGWNKNTDIFLASEIYKARSTPEDKPLNLMHDWSQIIGHITSSFVLDHSGRLLDDSFSEDFLPENIDIFSSAVIYRKWTDPDKQSEIERLIAEITDSAKDSSDEEPKWYVSMECMFPHFDYGIIGADGSNKIVYRNESTAYLTKYLRHYGGTGEFKEYKIGRVLRNLVFSGKGLVNNPANPTSFITRTLAQKIFVSTANLENFETEKVMSQENMVSLEKFKELEAQLASFQAKASEENQKKVSDLESQVATLKSDLSAKASKVAELEKSLSDSNSKLAELTKEQAKATRVSMLVEAGLEKAKALEVAVKFESVDDSAFASIVEIQKEAIAAKPMDKEEEEKKKKKEASDKAKAEEEAAKKALEQAKAEEEAALALQNKDKQVETAVAAIQNWFSANLTPNKSAKK